jgi:hypothetical protein
MRTAMTVLAVSFILASCAREPIEEVHTVDWFLDPANIETFISIQELCKSNPGEYGKKPNCVNAATARKNLYRIDFDGNFTSKTYTLEQTDKATNGEASKGIISAKYTRCLDEKGPGPSCDALLK